MSEALRHFWEAIGLIQRRIDILAGISAQTQNRILASLVIVLLTRALSRIASGVLHRHVQDPAQYYRYKKTIGFAFASIGILLKERR